MDLGGQSKVSIPRSVQRPHGPSLTPLRCALPLPPPPAGPWGTEMLHSWRSHAPSTQVSPTELDALLWDGGWDGVGSPGVAGGGLFSPKVWDPSGLLMPDHFFVTPVVFIFHTESSACLRHTRGDDSSSSACSF